MIFLSVVGLQKTTKNILQCLGKLVADNLLINLTKWLFAKTKIEYLDYIFNQQRIRHFNLEQK